MHLIAGFHWLMTRRNGVSIKKAIVNDAGWSFFCCMIITLYQKMLCISRVTYAKHRR